MAELRFDPITGEWVVVAADRGSRPSDYPGSGSGARVHGQDACPFCPGNESMTPPEVMAVRDPGTAPNTPGWTIRVIPNKYPAFSPDLPFHPVSEGLYDLSPAFGIHEIVVESPEDDLRMADMDLLCLGNILAVYRSRLKAIGETGKFAAALIFRNYGKAAGASLSHPHSQIVGIPVLPRLVAAELESFRAHLSETGQCLMCGLISQEIGEADRVIIHRDGFLAYAPFPSGLPYQFRIVPTDHGENFQDSADGDLAAFASVLKEALARLRNGLDDPPYNFILHTAPFLSEGPYHWYLDVTPRITTTAGFEWGTGFCINTVSPEEGAAVLRDADAK